MTLFISLYSRTNTSYFPKCVLHLIEVCNLLMTNFTYAMLFCQIISIA